MVLNARGTELSSLSPHPRTTRTWHPGRIPSPRGALSISPYESQRRRQTAGGFRRSCPGPGPGPRPNKPDTAPNECSHLRLPPSPSRPKVRELKLGSFQVKSVVRTCILHGCAVCALRTRWTVDAAAACDSLPGCVTQKKPPPPAPSRRSAWAEGARGRARQEGAQKREKREAEKRGLRGLRYVHHSTCSYARARKSQHAGVVDE